MNATAAKSLTIAAVLLAVATALGAIGSHALKPILTLARYESFQIAVNYQFFHALGLVGIALLQRDEPLSAGLRWAARLLVIGITLFAGSIYALTFGAPKIMGAVAPLGGLALIAAWLVLAYASAGRFSARD